MNMLGVRISRTAQRAGIQHANLKDAIVGKHDLPAFSYTKLERVLTDEVEAVFRGLAELALLPEPDSELVRAIAPSAIRLAQLLEPVAKAYDDAGWPCAARGMALQEQIDRAKESEAEKARAKEIEDAQAAGLCGPVHEASFDFGDDHWAAVRAFEAEQEEPK